MMEAGQAETARRNYNRMSRIYGLLSAGSEKRFVELAIGRLLRPAPGELILEPGFGSGQALAALAGAAGETGRVYGIDVSDGMVEVTRRRLERLGLTGRVVLTRGDAAAMSYENSFFDAVFMSFTLELFPDDLMPVVLRECARVLKEKGRICVASMSSRGKDGLMTRWYRWAHVHFPGFVDCRPIDARGTLETAGFRISEERVLSMWGLPVEILLAKKGAL